MTPRTTLLAAMLLGAAIGTGPTAAAQERKAGATFRDCPECPEMVVVPDGTFLMGSPRTEAGRDVDGSEDPQHQVTIAYAFAVGKYEVTRDEYARFVKETGLADPAGCNIHRATPPHWPTIKGLNWHNTGFSQTGRDPAVCVAWKEAQAYAAWLSKKTGKTYRLLSEAEWEYAARAGTTAAAYWGEKQEDACAYANGSDLTRKEKFPEWQADQPCHDGFVYTAPVGSFKPNAFGLYDMMGNVFEMTADCLYVNYLDAPADGSPRTTDDCQNRINRGGSWTSTPGGLRSAARAYDDIAMTRVVDLGFRVARGL
jgi:formylglycine-generating enzyme required for sulfatase activity